MKTSELLIDAHSRIQEVVHDVVEGLDDKTLATRPGDTANSIAWLVWHLTRVQDDHVADVAGTEQVWTAQGFVDRFGLPFDSAATGYGMTGEEVGHVRASAELLTAYLDVVHGAAAAMVGTAAAAAGGGVLVVVGTVVAALLAPAFVRYRVTRVTPR